MCGSTKRENVIILCVYRAPSGNFDYFLKTLGNILNSLYNHKNRIYNKWRYKYKLSGNKY